MTPTVTPPTKMKSAGATLDFYIDWSDWLTPGETILTATWTIVGTNTQTPALVLCADSGHLSYISAGFITYVWLSGGVVGKIYEVNVVINTSAGRTEVGGLRIKIVRER